MRSAIVGTLLAASSLTPAFAEDCFPKLPVAHVHVAPRHKPTHPHPPVARVQHAKAPVHKAKPVGAKRIAVKATAPVARPNQKLAESSARQQTLPVYVSRPTSCDKHPALTLASAPMDEKPVAQRLLDAMVGPEPQNDARPPVADSNAPFQEARAFPMGGSPGFSGPIGGGGGGGGGKKPPTDNPPTDNPPPSNPPTNPPVTPPEGPTPPPPVTTPPSPPPPGPPVPPVTPPEHPTPPPVAPVPEPGAWVMMIMGVFSVAGALRVRRKTVTPARVRI